MGPSITSELLGSVWEELAWLSLLVLTRPSCCAQGIPFNAVYCASKFAVEGLCESLAVILQPFNVQ